MKYSDLSTSQQEQARHDLFINDALFGFDPNDFDYEVNGEGIITGRCPLVAGPKVKRQQIRNQPVVFASTQLSEMSPETRYRIECVYNDLARAVAFRLAGISGVNVQAGCVVSSLAAGEVPAVQPVIL